MMISVDSNYLYLLQISNALLLVIVFFSLARFERRCKTIEAFWDSPTGTIVADVVDIDDVADSQADEQTRVTQELERQVAELQRNLQTLQHSAPETTAVSLQRDLPPVERSLPIENALRMAKLGASIDELTKNCGLNVGEARLMQKLHGKAKLATAGT